MFTFTSVATSQNSVADSIFLVPVPNESVRLPSINILSPEEIAAFTEKSGKYILRVINPYNTYRWNDGTETITFGSEFTSVAVCRYDNAAGETEGYMIIAFYERDGLPNKTETGLFRKLKDLD
jgi:hypothetical protein